MRKPTCASICAMVLLLAAPCMRVLAADLSEDIGKNAIWRRTLPIIDVHGHINSQAVEKTLALMDASGISRIVNLTAGRNAAEFEAAKKLFDAKGKDRFILYVNDVYENFPIEDPDFGKKVASTIEACVKLGAKGMKVSKGLGLLWKDKAGKTVAIDDPRLEEMWKACARLGIPVSIHSGDPKAFWLPVDEKNERYEELKFHPEWAFGADFPRREAILAQLENVIARHRDVTIVGVHFGNDPEDPEHISNLLRKYPNFNVDLAARVPEIGRQNPDKLRKLFIEHQDRILFGTDFMVSPAGFILGAGPRLTDDKEVKKYFDAQWRFLETSAKKMDTPTPIQGSWKIDAIHLPTEVLEKIYYKNAERIILKQK